MKIVDGWSAIGANDTGKYYSCSVGFHPTIEAAQAACDHISDTYHRLHDDEPIPLFKIVPAKAEEYSFIERFRISAASRDKYSEPYFPSFFYVFFFLFFITALPAIFLSVVLGSNIILAASLLSIPLAVIIWFDQTRLKMSDRYRQLKTEYHPTAEYV